VKLWKWQKGNCNGNSLHHIIGCFRVTQTRKRKRKLKRNKNCVVLYVKERYMCRPFSYTLDVLNYRPTYFKRP
jgi:hypothetical protein